jgi:LysM repeat protein
VGDVATKCIVCGTDLTAGDKKKKLGQTGQLVRPASASQPLPVVKKSQTQPIRTVNTPSLSQSQPISAVTGDTGALPHPPMPPKVKSKSAGQFSISLPIFIGSLFLMGALAIGASLLILNLNGGGASVTPTVAATATFLPTYTPQPSPTATPEPTATPLPPLLHTVVENDTCISLAYQYNVTQNSIREVNGFPESCNLPLGVTIKIPQPTATAGPTLTSTVEPYALTVAARPTHIVSAGESLSSLAQYYNVDFKTFAEVNGKLAPDYTIAVGERLIVPKDVPPPTEGPSPTPTALPPKPAPELLNPADGFAVSSVEQTVNLEWSSVAVLAENEVYLVTVEDISSGGSQKIVAATTTNRYVVTVEMKPLETNPHIFRWNVVVARVVGQDSSGKPIYELAGTASSERTFSWAGIGVAVPTPTPVP